MLTSRAWLSAATLALTSIACSPPPAPVSTPEATAAPALTKAPVDAPPDKVAVDAGKDCVKAEAECSGGLCDVTVKNGCDQPVTCDVGIGAVCKTDAEMIDAKGRGRDTVAAKANGKIQVVANCQRGVVMTTEVKDMHCR